MRSQVDLVMLVLPACILAAAASTELRAAAPPAEDAATATQPAAPETPPEPDTASDLGASIGAEGSVRRRQPRASAAADVADAPLPRDASGALVERQPEGAALVVPRLLLFVPRWLLEVVMAVPRFALWTFDRFQVSERWKSIFFNDTGTIGVYPVAFVEAGFGLNAGARFFHRDLVGHGERLRLRASYGGRFRQLYSVKLTTGELLGQRLMVTLEGDYEIYPKSRFYGIGNRDLEAPAAGRPLIDPLTDRTAIKTRYRHDDGAVRLAVEVLPSERVRLRIAGLYKHRDFSTDVETEDDPEITTVYQSSRLVGFDSGLDNIYVEAEVTVDTRRTVGYFISPATPSTGWRLVGFVGHRAGLGNDASGHARYGIDAARTFNLYGGDRVLVLRTYLEGVIGDLEEIAFVDLPRLGGPVFLRGYDRDRFQDRIVTLATVEYVFPTGRNTAGYLFADAGRVWRSYEEMRLRHMRLGFGGGLQLHTVNSFLSRLFVASSIDGGLFFNLSFDPSFDVRSREETP